MDGLRCICIASSSERGRYVQSSTDVQRKPRTRAQCRLWCLAVLARRDIPHSRPRLQTARAYAHADLLLFPVAFRRAEDRQILCVDLVGDGREGRAEILAVAYLHVPSAALFG